MRLGEATGSDLKRAIEIFVRHAYPTGEIPANRRQFTDLPSDPDLAELFALRGVVEVLSDDDDPAEEAGVAFRIGNDRYPHMKLVARRRSSPPGFVLSVDTHDRLRIPPDSPEAAELRRLQDRNQQLARWIEEGWEAEGLPTQAGLLRRYLTEHRSPDGENHCDVE